MRMIAENKDGKEHVINQQKTAKDSKENHLNQPRTVNDASAAS